MRWRFLILKLTGGGSLSSIMMVGIGPGDTGSMTRDAVSAMERADILCGYGVYLDLVRDMFPDKPTISTSMRQEKERCHLALEAAEKGSDVAFICSGDAGIYGMAGLLMQMAAGIRDLEIMVVPGVTAAVSGAAALGAPLMNDFCVISLSDILTPREVIEKRLRCAAEGDFAICLYNPASVKRPDHLRRACEILLEYKAPGTVCGWVRNIGRNGQEKRLLTLGELAGAKADMFTTVFVGTSGTLLVDGRMVTPRGYEVGK